MKPKMQKFSVDIIPNAIITKYAEDVREKKKFLELQDTWRSSWRFIQDPMSKT